MMKRNIKIFALIFTLLLSLFCFCGCQSTDKTKSTLDCEVVAMDYNVELNETNVSLKISFDNSTIYNAKKLAITLMYNEGFSTEMVEVVCTVKYGKSDTILTTVVFEGTVTSAMLVGWEAEYDSLWGTYQTWLWIAGAVVLIAAVIYVISMISEGFDLEDAWYEVEDIFYDGEYSWISWILVLAGAGVGGYFAIVKSHWVPVLIVLAAIVAFIVIALLAHLIQWLVELIDDFLVFGVDGYTNSDSTPSTAVEAPSPIIRVLEKIEKGESNPQVLLNFTKEELLQYCKTNEISGYSKLNKQGLVELIVSTVKGESEPLETKEKTQPAPVGFSPFASLGDSVKAPDSIKSSDLMELLMKGPELTRHMIFDPEQVQAPKKDDLQKSEPVKTVELEKPETPKAEPVKTVELAKPETPKSEPVKTVELAKPETPKAEPVKTVELEKPETPKAEPAKPPRVEPIKETIPSTDVKAFAYMKNGEGVTVTEYLGGYAEVVLPSAIEGLPVTAIAPGAFDGYGDLTAVTVPDTVTDIGESAFAGCIRLKRVKLGAGVRNIGARAFAFCDSLSSISVDSGNSVYKDIAGDVYTKDGATLVQYAIGKSSVKFALPNAVVKIGEGAFRDCRRLTTVLLNYNVTAIGGFAFENCRGLKSMVIPDGVESIGEGAFRGCRGLTGIAIPDSVAQIGADVFSGCASLMNLSLPENVTEIPKGSFRGCYRLADIEIPHNVKAIGAEAFYNCEQLPKIVLRSNVTKIGEYAFDGCENLKIYCEVQWKPLGWNPRWNSSEKPVVWGRVNA